MQDPIRIIAWGNRGRCDDGVALVLAERLQRRYADDAEVCIQQYHQLGPELVDDLSRSRLAIFLDAHLREDRDEVFMERVEPREAAGLNTHHCHPPVLLALGRSMRFRVPEAYMVCVRGRNFDFGDRLSEATERAMLEAEQIVIKLITSGKGGLPGEGSAHA